MQEEVKKFERRLQLHLFFEQLKLKNQKTLKPKAKQDNTTPCTDKQQYVPFTKNPHFWPPNINHKINIFCHNLKVDIFNMHKVHPKDNLTKKERLALKDLRTDKNITIKKETKGPD